MKAIFDAITPMTGTTPERERVTWLDWTGGGRVRNTRIGLTDPDLQGSSFEDYFAPVGAVRMTQEESDGEGRVVALRTGGSSGLQPAFDENSLFATTLYGDFAGGLAQKVTVQEPRAGTSTSTSIGYDALGRANSTTDAGSRRTLTSYDESGNVTSVKLPGRNTETRRYDGRGLLLGVTTPDGEEVTYQYDAKGDVLQRQDEEGERTFYETDAFGRPRLTRYPDGTTEETRYEDVTGALAAVKNRAGQWRSFVYDVGGQIIEIHQVETATAGNAPTMIERRSYDEAGRLRKVANRDGAIEYLDRDMLGRPQTTRATRYRSGTGLTTEDVLDVHTQKHEWNVFDERKKYSMPAAGTVVPLAQSSSGWRTWIDEVHDAVGNLTSQSSGGSAFTQSIGRAAGRMFERTRAAGNSTLQSVYRYADGTATSPIYAMPGQVPAVAGAADGLLGRVQTLRGNATVDGQAVTRNAQLGVGTIEHLSMGERKSVYEYDARGRLETSLLMAASLDAEPTTDVHTPAGFRRERQSPEALSPAQHEILGREASLALEVLPWTATQRPGHQLDDRTESLDGEPQRTTEYEFVGGRRHSDGEWQTTYDEFDRVIAQKNATDRRELRYAYDPNGRLIGRTAFELVEGDARIETRASVLNADGLPAETTFVWDPVTDRLAAIYRAGQSVSGESSEAGLLRQYIHGDQAYDDPVEVLVENGGRAVRYLTLRDEAATGNLTAIFDANGILIERVLYGDAYGFAPRYLHGPVVDQIAINVLKDNIGNVSEVKVRVRLTETIDASTLANGVRLAAINAQNTVVSESTVAPLLDGTSTIEWKLGATDWALLSGASGATAIEIAVTDTLRAPAWGSTPVQPIPAWATRLCSGTSSSARHPVIVREQLAAIQGAIGEIAAGEQGSRKVYEIASPYLAAAESSRTRLFTGFKAAPFVEPAIGSSYLRYRWYDPGIGTFLTADPMGYHDSSTLNAALGNDPVNNSDPTGLFFTPETAWDLVSLGLGAYQISRWDENTPFAARVLDVVGVVVDLAAVVVPALPGGVGAGVKAYRAGDAMHDAYWLGRSVDRGLDAIQGIDQALNAGQAGIYMGEAFYNRDPLAFGMSALQFGIGFRSLSTRGVGGYRLEFSGGHATANSGAVPRVVRKPPRAFEEIGVMPRETVKASLTAEQVPGARNWAYPIHYHHIYPKWLGGLEEGPVMRIRGYEHISDLEPELRSFVMARIPMIRQRTTAHVAGLLERGVVSQDRITEVLTQFYRSRYPNLTEETIREVLGRGVGR